MTTNVDQFNSAGLDRVYWAVNSAAGYPYGLTGVLANGADAAMSRLVGAQNINLPLQPPRQVSIPGDNSVQAIYFFAPETLPNGDLVLGNIDLNLWAQSQGIKVYTDGDWHVVVGQPDSPTFKTMTLIVIADGKSAQSGSVGNAGYYVKIYPRVQIVPIGDQGLTNATGSNFTHQLVANKFDTLPWGKALAVADQGTTGGAVYGPLFSENRVCLHTHISDGADLTFTLPYLPAAANANKVKAWRNGVALTYTTDFAVNASTGVVTLVAAGTAGDVVIVRYEHL